MKTEIILKDGTKLEYPGMCPQVVAEEQEITIVDHESIVEGTLPFNEVREVHFYPEAE